MDVSILTEIMENVYKTLGPGYKENVYHSAVLIELRDHSIEFHSEVICPIEYKGIQVGFERADVVIYNEKNMIGVLEFKAQQGNITNKEIVQIRKYLRNFSVTNGLLLNFSNTLEIYSVTLTNHVKLS